MTGNPSLAEDLTQETFLLVFRKIQSFAGMATPRFCECGLNEEAHQGLETPLEEKLGTEGDFPALKELVRSDPQLSGVVDRVILKNALKQLPREYKKIFLLHDLMGYEHHESAETLGCAIGTSKSQLHKARISLRTLPQNGTSTNPLSAESPVKQANSFHEEAGTSQTFC